MSLPSPVPLESLLRHAAGLRSLARGLLGDPQAAEDVVQETWIAAIERPPESRERLSGWLRKVTRNQALQRRREEGRRATREGFASTVDDLAAVGDSFRAREVLRDVVDAVLELEEPYQSTVIERFFRDLPPREIARRRGIPVTTTIRWTGRRSKVPKLFLRTDACDARVVLDEGIREVVVPAGLYLLAHEGRTFSTPATRIALAPGEVAAPSGDLSDRIPVTFAFELDAMHSLAFALSDQHGQLAHETDLGLERSARTYLPEGGYRLRAQSAGRVAETSFEISHVQNAEAVVRAALD